MNVVLTDRFTVQAAFVDPHDEVTVARLRIERRLLLPSVIPIHVEPVRIASRDVQRAPASTAGPFALLVGEQDGRHRNAFARMKNDGGRNLRRRCGDRCERRRWRHWAQPRK